ncbi:MAG: hypothetical protein GXP25_25470 [Planctomycetes bacterium]|nr:hypothetical protein [Planctomycetota bacterium]
MLQNECDPGAHSPIPWPILWRLGLLGLAVSLILRGSWLGHCWIGDFSFRSLRAMRVDGCKPIDPNLGVIEVVSVVGSFLEAIGWAIFGVAAYLLSRIAPGSPSSEKALSADRSPSFRKAAIRRFQIGILLLVAGSTLCPALHSWRCCWTLVTAKWGELQPYMTSYVAQIAPLIVAFGLQLVGTGMVLIFAPKMLRVGQADGSLKLPCTIRAWACVFFLGVFPVFFPIVFAGGIYDVPDGEIQIRYWGTGPVAHLLAASFFQICALGLSVGLKHDRERVWELIVPIALAGLIAAYCRSLFGVWHFIYCFCERIRLVEMGGCLPFADEMFKAMLNAFHSITKLGDVKTGVVFLLLMLCLRPLASAVSIFEAGRVWVGVAFVLALAAVVSGGHALLGVFSLILVAHYLLMWPRAKPHRTDRAMKRLLLATSVLGIASCIPWMSLLLRWVPLGAA